MKNAKNVEEYFATHDRWLPILEKLREIILSSGLKEAIKWGAPTYMLNNKNLVAMAAFKNHVALWFFQGALLQDPQKILINAQEGKTQALRQIRYTASEQVDGNTLSAYISETIQNHEAGRAIKPVKKKPFEIHEDLKQALLGDEELSNSFNSLSRSRQREFTEYISEAKRAETRQGRLLKIIPMIKANLGLNDKYR